MKKTLKSIDFYQVVPSNLTEGTLSGACITTSTIVIILSLVLGAIVESMRPITHSDMIIDQKHLNNEIKVNIDIQFPRYPCSMLSLDIENVLRVHEVNVNNNRNLLKYNLDDMSQFIEISSEQQSYKRIISDFEAKKGCRLMGYFQVDPVPGNFHISGHAYGKIYQKIIKEKQLKKKIDLSHRVNHLYFGESKTGGPFNQGFESKKEIDEGPSGITYTYFLDIFETVHFLHEDIGNNFIVHHYTIRMNEVTLAKMPMVLFRYETSPITLIFMRQFEEWHFLLIRIIGIIGGIFTVASIIDGVLHSSVGFLLSKYRLGKLR